jgi:hypothetical protein
MLPSLCRECVFLPVRRPRAFKIHSAEIDMLAAIAVPVTGR